MDGVLPTLAEVFFASVYAWYSNEMTSVVLKKHQAPSPGPVLQQEDRSEVVESDDDDRGAAVDIQSISPTTDKAWASWSEPTRFKICTPF